MKRKRTEGWSGKQLHGQFKRETEDLSGVSLNWIKTGERKNETEGLIFARPGTKNKRRKSLNRTPKCIKQMQNVW